MDRMLPRCTPEEAGIASKTLENLLDALEDTGTEMHGLMIARHGKVCAEGWWAPYAPNLVHGDQSLTKTYTITALGLLHDEGKLELEEKLVDIFPQYMPEVISENLQAMTVRNLMSFGSGVEQMVSIADADWLRRFFALPVTNPPGSSFFYSGVCTAVGGAIVRERTGMGLIAYLTPRLFDKIGIDASHIKTIYTGDGLEYGGGGFFTTTEDNLRLMLQMPAAAFGMGNASCPGNGAAKSHQNRSIPLQRQPEIQASQTILWAMACNAGCASRMVLTAPTALWDSLLLSFPLPIWSSLLTKPLIRANCSIKRYWTRYGPNCCRM